jgi:hypothetical protein
MSKVNRIQTSACPAPILPVVGEGALAGVIHGLRSAMAASIKQSPRSRYQLVGHMSELLARDVSKEMLDKYTSDSAEAHRPPADTLAAFCLATQSLAALDVLAEAVGCVLVPVGDGLADELPRELRCGILRVTQELGEAATAVEESLSDGDLTPEEARRIGKELRDVIQRASGVMTLLGHYAQGRS